MTHEVIDTIKQRRSIRSYIDKPLEKQVLEDIIQAGKYAPSAKNDQPWRFIIITNKEKIRALSNQVKDQMKGIIKKKFFLQFAFKELRKKKTVMMLYGMAMAPSDVIFHDAPALIFIITKKRQFYDASCACCAENMMLAAHSLGVGSCWIGFAHFLNRNAKVLADLQIPKEYHISAALIFGYPKEQTVKTPLRKPMADVINWIS